MKQNELLEKISRQLDDITRLLKVEAVSGELLTAELAPPVFNITVIEKESGSFEAFLETTEGRKALKASITRLRKDREI